MGPVMVFMRLSPASTSAVKDNRRIDHLAGRGLVTGLTDWGRCGYLPSGLPGAKEGLPLPGRG